LELVDVAAGDAATARALESRIGRQLDDVPAPVRRIALPLDQAALLERVETTQERRGGVGRAA